mmetsp:Transcript_31639/g.41906  ORF Transcript_31639/g.41906 Transcript_31639/m.41906 type:complete len:140 (+) Transcript_31639:634-1053(+)
MYTNDINDLLQVNLYSLRQIYELFAKNQNYPRNKNLVEILPPNMPSIDQITCALYRFIDNVGESKLIQAFYASKQLVQEETTQAGMTEYTILRWGEFLEFVCRLAYLKFRGTPKEHSLTLLDKVKSILDDLLPIVSSKR